VPRARATVLLNRPIGLAPGASAASLGPISFRGDLDSTGSCSQVVRHFGTVQGQIPRDGS